MGDWALSSGHLSGRALSSRGLPARKGDKVRVVASPRLEGGCWSIICMALIPITELLAPHLHTQPQRLLHMSIQIIQFRDRLAPKPLTRGGYG